MYAKSAELVQTNQEAQIIDSLQCSLMNQLSYTNMIYL